MGFNGLDLGKELEFFTPYWKLHSKKKKEKSACGHFFLSPQISERDIISVVVVSGMH